MVVFTALSILGAALAVVMKKKAKQVYITCGVLFSAGVLLAGGLVHLLFDSREHFEEAGIESFQWAEAITGVTVVALVSLEWVVDSFMASTNKASEKSVKSAEEDGVVEEPAVANEEEDSFTDNRDEHGDGHDHEHIHAIDEEKPLGSLLLTIALSIHSIIEGIGIGEADSEDTFYSSFIAVAFHKAFTAFALGNSLVSDGLWENKSRRKYFYLSVGLFIILSIIGIAIGWAISVAEDILTTAIFIGITGGSFVYVATMEILPEESKNIKREKLPTFPVVFSFVTGYVLMSVLALWA
jgi:zinc transporter ZupT